MDETARKFVDYAVRLSYADLTPRAIHAVKRSFVDSIGCAIGASRVGPVLAVHELARQATGTHPATIIGTPIRTTPDLAAFVNGVMVRYLDFSDDYFGRSGIGPHPSDNISGILAAAESAGSDGKMLVLGIALAYEACGQLVDNTRLRPSDGWDHPIFHSIATALGAGKVLGLSQEQMHHALGLAVVPNICLYQTRRGELSNWKGCAGPNGSRNGLFAVQLAKAGISGPAEPFEGKAGYKRQLNDAFELGAFGGRDVPYKIENTFFKPLPLRYSVQLLVWAALELRDKVSVQNIKSMCVYTESRSITTPKLHPEHWDPRTRETADHSAPYLIAEALLRGSITAQSFTPEHFRDPAVLALMQRIRLEEDAAYTAAYPGTLNCRLEVTLDSGDVVTLHQVNPKGHPANPMSDQEIEDKFLRQVDALMPKPQSRALLDRLWTLEALDSIEKLFPLTQVSCSN